MTLDAEQPEADPASRRRLLYEALVVFGLCTLVCAVLVQLRPVVPFIDSNVHGLIAAVFLFVPTEIIIRRGESFSRFGLIHTPVGKGLLIFLGASLLVFPLFGLAFFFYYRKVCAVAAAGALTMPAQIQRLCRRWAGSFSAARLKLDLGYANMVLTQVLVVGLPEEYFFRGYLQTRLEDVWPSRRRLLGAPMGRSVLASSALFALGHLLVDFNGLRLAVFFPGLVFGWMRQATGSILAGVLFHACSNLLSDLLHRAFFP